jgi:hypothetical protein
MQVQLNADGTVNRAYRPYFDREELDVWRLYNPYDRSNSVCGNLYSRNQAPCQDQLNFAWRQTATLDSIRPSGYVMNNGKVLNAVDLRRCKK